MKYVMIGLINFYRKFISPLKPNCCRFTPTCSAYALEAFRKRGFFVGFILTVWRILRCNPFSKGGYDPVPERGFRVRPEDRLGRVSTNETDAYTPIAEENESLITDNSRDDFTDGANDDRELTEEKENEI